MFIELYFNIFYQTFYYPFRLVNIPFTFTTHFKKANILIRDFITFFTLRFYFFYFRVFASLFSFQLRFWVLGSRVRSLDLRSQGLWVLGFRSNVLGPLGLQRALALAGFLGRSPKQDPRTESLAIGDNQIIMFV